MAFDRSEFAATVAEKQHERNAQMLPMARILTGAAPIMERVTKSEDWNRYLTFLQGFLERLTKQKDIATAKLADPAVWNTEDLLKLKSDILIAQTGMDWLNLAISLPKAIMEGADNATTLIAQFEAKNEAAGKAQP